MSMSLHDWMGNNGATQPWYGYLNTPPGIYVSATNKTWVAWEGWTGTTRGVYVRVYDHASTKWGNTFLVTSANELVDDDHGNPSLVRDNSGYVYVFYGAHATNQLVASTTNPDDPSAWTIQTPISGQYTYPTPVLVNGQIWLFFRFRNAGNGEQYLVLRQSTSLVAGVPTWAASDIAIFNLGAGVAGRTYHSRLLSDSNYIYICTVKASSDDVTRQNIYHCRYKITTGDVSTTDGSHTTLAASLPVLPTEADSFYRIYNSGSNVTDVAGHCFDSAGNIHIAFPTCAFNAIICDLLHMKFSGGAWSGTDTIVSGIDAAAGIGPLTYQALLDIGNGQIESWYFQDPLHAFVGGGNMVKKTLANGVWGSETPVLNYGTVALFCVGDVLNANPSLQMLFCERTQSELDSAAGYMRLYAFGSNSAVPAAQTTTAIATLATRSSSGISSTTWSNPGPINLDVNTSGDRSVHDTIMNPWSFHVPSAWNGRYGRLTGNVSLGAATQVNFYKGTNQTPAGYAGDALSNIITSAEGDNTANFRTSVQPLNTDDTYIFGTVGNGIGINSSNTWGSMELLPLTFLGAVAYQSGTQTIPGGNVLTNLLFDTNLFDTSGFHSVVSNTDRMVIPSGVSLARASGHIVYTAQTGSQRLDILKNGTNFVGEPLCRDNQGGVGAVLLSGYTAIQLVQLGDYFTMDGATANAGSNNVTGWLEVEALPGDLKYALVTTNSGQTITNGAFQTVNWETHIADIGGWHSDVTNNSRLTVPKGISNIRLTAQISTNAVTTSIECKFKKNGADFVGSPLQIANDSSVGTQGASFVSPVLAVSPGDFFEVQVLTSVNFTTQVSGNITWFQAEEVRADPPPPTPPPGTTLTNKKPGKYFTRQQKAAFLNTIYQQGLIARQSFSRFDGRSDLERAEMELDEAMAAHREAVERQETSYSRKDYDAAEDAAEALRAAEDKVDALRKADARQRSLDDAKAKIRKQIDDAITKRRGR